MPYLCLKIDAGERRHKMPYRSGHNDQLPSCHFFYPISEEGYTLIAQWQSVYWDEDQIESGVLADWLEENAEYLLVGAVGPTDPAVRLNELIQYLRSRLVGV